MIIVTIIIKIIIVINLYKTIKNAQKLLVKCKIGQRNILYLTSLTCIYFMYLALNLTSNQRIMFIFI